MLDFSLYVLDEALQGLTVRKSSTFLLGDAAQSQWELRDKEKSTKDVPPALPTRIALRTACVTFYNTCREINFWEDLHGILRIGSGKDKHLHDQVGSTARKPSTWQLAALTLDKQK